MYVRSCNSATKLRDDFLLNGLLLLLLLLLEISKRRIMEGHFSAQFSTPHMIQALTIFYLT